MKSEDIYTVGDLISYLQNVDPNKRIYVYNAEYGEDNPLQYIDVELDRIIIYDWLNHGYYRLDRFRTISILRGSASVGIVED